MSMPDHIADELAAARKVAINWIKMQYASNLHLVNTGRRDKYAGHIYRANRIIGEAAMERIEAIKQEYPSR